MSFAERFGHYTREQIEAMEKFVREYGRDFGFYLVAEVENGKRVQG